MVSLGSQISNARRQISNGITENVSKLRSLLIANLVDLIEQAVMERNEFEIDETSKLVEIFGRRGKSRYSSIQNAFTRKKFPVWDLDICNPISN